MQHQLAISHDNLGRLVPAGIGTNMSSTNAIHDAAGHHAADGALPMVLASVMPGVVPNNWFSTPNKEGRPYDAPPSGPFDASAMHTAGKDPLHVSEMWPASSREVFRKQAEEKTGASYPWTAPRL